MKIFSRTGFRCALFVLVATLAGCGGGGNANTGNTNNSTVHGVAATGLAIDGIATLRDKDGTTRTTTISQPDGEFEFDVAGLNPPYFMKVTPSAGGTELYSVATDNGNFNINPLANLTMLAAAKGMDPATQTADAAFNDPAKYADLTSDQVAAAVDRVLSRFPLIFRRHSRPTARAT